jgi:hypothetical protein
MNAVLTVIFAAAELAKEVATELLPRGFSDVLVAYIEHQTNVLTDILGIPGIYEVDAPLFLGRLTVS